MRLIDADELLENNTWDFFNEYGQYTNAGLAVKDAPTIEPKHGRWISENMWDYKCSVCGVITRHTRTNYCGFCGARMDEVEE